MITSTLYRQYAADCREIANILSTEDVRSQLLTIAAEWDKLASDAVQASHYQPFEETSSSFWS